MECQHLERDAINRRTGSSQSDGRLNEQFFYKTIDMEFLMSIQTITPKGLSELIRSGKKVDLIDVRTPVEYREVHADIAKSLPLDQLNLEKIASLRTDASQPLYIICKSGGRGKQGCEKLLSLGQSNVINVEGGTTAWEQAGLPVVRGKKAMSLERQVRIAAGALVFTGSALGFFRPSLFHRTIRVCGCRSHVCRFDRHMRHGHDDCQDAMESSSNGIEE